MSSVGTDWGSVADWVSGIGSIGASAVALYLAGSERRARREGERPIVSCRSEEGGGEGWVRLFISFDNPSSKQWQCVRAEVVRPRDSRIVHESAATDYESADGLFSEALRDQYAVRVLPMEVAIGPLGSTHPTFAGGGRGNYTYRRIYAWKGAANALYLRLHLESLEPSPDRFSVMIKR